MADPGEGPGTRLPPLSRLFSDQTEPRGAVFRLPTDHFYPLKNNMFLLTVTFENLMSRYLQPA